MLKAVSSAADYPQVRQLMASELATLACTIGSIHSARMSIWSCTAGRDCHAIS
jgi:hypothetical protein